MAVIQKTLFAKNLSNYNVLVNDLDQNSKYFKISELSDTFTGGKNAFLIAGSEYLVADTKIQIELKDSAGNIIYNEPGEGLLSSTINGEQFVTEYYEGVSKVVAVYIYPDTAYGECTLTILGELNQYVDANGITQIVPTNWENKYNVKWETTINVNPNLANTTKIRFYKRPTVTINELISPVYRIDNTTGQKINTGINQSFANIKVSNLETFAGDVKRIKVFRTSLGDISDYDMIQDILVESKELLTSYGLTGSVVGNTGILTSDSFKNYWNTGSLIASLDSNRVDSGAKLNGPGIFAYSSSLDLKSANTYELNLDAFYSASTNSNLGIYLSWISKSVGFPDVTFSSSIATLVGTQPTKNLLDTVIPFKINKDYPSASLYFSQSQGEWHLGNISLKLSEDTAFSPDEVSFITTMPTVVGNEDFNFKFEFYDVNNNYVPVLVTGSANFTGGSNAITKLLTFESDRTAFRFSTGSFANPPNQNVRFKTTKTNFTGSITYASSAFDVGGTYIEPSSYAGTYPGWFTSQNDNGALLSIASFSGSVSSVLVGSIVYTASCEGFQEFETIYRFEDGDNAPGVFVTANTNQFIYKATDLSLNPVGQVITIEAKRKNLASATTPLTVNSGSGKPPLTLISTNATNGVNTYTLAGSSYSYLTGEAIYYISGSDQFGNEFSDAIKISPVKILDGLSATLTNDNASLPALSNGFVASGSFLFTSGSINVKVGNETIVFDDDNDTARANNTFAITNVTGLGCTPNGGNNTNPSQNAYSITNITADSGSLDITIDYKDGAGDTTSLIKTVTYTKNKKAAPVLAISSTPKDQSVTAKSTGEQIDSFLNASIVVKETYNGSTSNLTITSLTATSSDIGSISTTPSTGLITLNGKTLADGTNSTTINITAVVTDSEGVSRTITDTLSLSKVKKAAPVTLVLLSSETQTILSSSAGYTTPATFTISVNEGGTNYTYDDSVPYDNSTFRITSISGGSGTTTITPTTPTTTTGTTVSLTISYKNSEGTTGTITKTHKVAVSLEGIQGVTGNDGKRTSANVVHYQLTSATAPPTPTATSFTFTTGVFTGLTANWSTGAPTYASGNTNKYWYSSYTVVETTAGSGIGTPTFGTPTQAIGFSGLVSFTSANALDNGLGNTLSFGVAGATLINGSNISTGIIKSTNFDFGGSDTDASGSFMDAGTIFNLDNGSLRSKNFYINQAGDAFFKGTLSAAAGTFAGNLTAAGGTFAGQITVGGTDYNLSDTLNANTTKSQVGLGSVSNLTPQNQAQTGLIAGTTITGGGITLSDGGTIKGGQTGYNTGTGFFLGYDGTAPNGAYKFSIGNASSKGITWDGSALSIGGDVTIGGTLANTIKNGAASGAAALQPSQAANDVNTNTTNIIGAKIRTGNIESNNWDGPDAGEEYADAGMQIDLTNGSITAKNFLITSAGAAKFRGRIESSDGVIGGWIIGASTLESANNKTIFDATNNSITTKDTTTGDIRVKISNETTLPFASSLVNVYSSNISSQNYNYVNTTAGDAGVVNNYTDGADFTVAVGGVYNMSYGVGHSLAGSSIFATGQSSITARYYLQLYNVTTNTVVFEDGTVIGAGTANGSSYNYGGGFEGNNTGYATPNPTGTGSGINPITLVTGQTYRTRIRFYQSYYIDSNTSYYPLPDVGYTIPGYFASLTLYTTNTRTTINAAGLQTLIDGTKYFEVKNGTNLFDNTTSTPSKYSTSVRGDFLLDGLFIKNPFGSSFFKYYPSLAAQAIIYSIGGSPLAYKQLTGAFPFYTQGDGISSITRNSVGVFTVTLKSRVYNTFPNVVVSGTGEQYDTVYTSTKYSVVFVDNKSFKIRCVRSNDNTMVDPFTINIAVFSTWDTANAYD
jgi:hypothetical protein